MNRTALGILCPARTTVLDDGSLVEQTPALGTTNARPTWVALGPLITGHDGAGPIPVKLTQRL